MKILGIESSCDETAASVIQVNSDNTIIELSRVTATSLTLHAKTGGIIPEVAARNQIKDIIPVVYQALSEANVLRLETGDQRPNIDAIAVTYGPGLIGSLLVGVETAKTLSYVWDIPLIPVNHLLAHLYVNWISSSSRFSVLGSQNLVNQSSVDQSGKLKTEKPKAENRNQKTDNKNYQSPDFPAIGLIVSGGHTDLVLIKSHKEIIWLGGTRDDAAGEAFDKTGRMLGIEYPAGPTIEKLAKEGNPKAYHFPRPLMYDKELDFSFSGLKTAVLREVERIKEKKEAQGTIFSQDARRSPVPRRNLYPSVKLNTDLCRGVQDAIIDVLVYKTLQAAKQFNAKSIILGGGVAANQTLRDTFQEKLATNDQLSATMFFVPPKNLCTDNGTMIATAAVFQNKKESWQNITANPELYFE